MENEILKEQENKVEELVAFFRRNPTQKALLNRLDDYHENDIAGALELMSSRERERLYPLIGAKRMADIWPFLEDPKTFIEGMDTRKVARIISEMDADEAVDFLDELEEPLQEEIEKYLTGEIKEDIELIQSYEDDEIGSWMTTNFILISKDLSIRDAMKNLVKQAGSNDNISTIYVEDEHKKFYGAIDLKDLIIARSDAVLEDLISTEYPCLRDHEKISECIERIREYEEDSLPILDRNNEILGIITSQDIIEVVDTEKDDDYAKLAGLIESEDLDEKPLRSMRKRLPWLIVLFILDLLVSSVVGVFEGIIAIIPIVICFQSMILDMAGNVGTQSLAVTIRVLTDGEVSGKEKAKLVLKECRVGFLNGLVLALTAFVLVGLYIYFFREMRLGMAFLVSGTVAVSLLAGIVIASLIGTLIPLFFHKIKIDPAVASGPLISTINDLVTIVTYYSLAYFFLIRVFQII